MNNIQNAYNGKKSDPLMLRSPLLTPAVCLRRVKTVISLYCSFLLLQSFIMRLRAGSTLFNTDTKKQPRRVTAAITSAGFFIGFSPINTTNNSIKQKLLHNDNGLEKFVSEFHKHTELGVSGAPTTSMICSLASTLMSSALSQD